MDDRLGHPGSPLSNKRIHFLMFSHKQTHLAHNVISVYSKLNGRKKRKKQQKTKRNMERKTLARQVKGNSSILGETQEERGHEAACINKNVPFLHLRIPIRRRGQENNEHMGLECYFTGAASKAFCPRADNLPFRHRPFQIHNPSGS